MSHVAVAKFGSRPWIPAEWELHRPRGRGKNKSSVFAFFHHQEKDFLSSLHVRTLIYDMWFLCCCRRGLNTNGEYDTATNLHKTFCRSLFCFFLHLTVSLAVLVNVSVNISYMCCMCGVLFKVLALNQQPDRRPQGRDSPADLLVFSKERRVTMTTCDIITDS